MTALAVVGADGGLLVVEVAQFEEGSALTEVVELGGEVGELGGVLRLRWSWKSS